MNINLTYWVITPFSYQVFYTQDPFISRPLMAANEDNDGESQKAKAKE